MTKLRVRFESEFPPDLFVIDPVGCGCIDCGMGYSTPLNEVDVEVLLTATLDFGMRVIDRTGRTRGQS